MNIALLDDLISDAEYLNNLIQQCAYENNISLKTSIYTDVSEFYNDIEKYDFSAVFIDILMPGTNGIDLASKIREINKSVPIIFVTTEKSFALEGYDVHAFDYVIKPAPPSRITDILKRLNDTVNEYTITINKNHTVINIPASSLIYAEARGHNVYINTNSATYKVYMSFKDFIDLLPDNKSFFVYSRGALVNFENVISISNDTLIMNNGINLHISRSKVSEIKTSYADYIFKKTRRVTL